MSFIRKKTIDGLKKGDTFRIFRTFTERDVISFADISRDYNPVHFDDRFAKTKKLSGRICHGLLVAGMVTEIGGQIGWLASGINFRFKKPVYFGDTIECRFVITEIDEKLRGKAEVVFMNQDGEVVLEALLTGILPGDEERTVLESILAEGKRSVKACG
jgi:acyl dehydratase